MRRRGTDLTFTADDLFEPTDPWSTLNARPLRANLVDHLRHGPVDGTDDLEVAVALVELLQAEFVAYGTDGGEQMSDREAALAVRALRATLARLSIAWSPPWLDFTGFKTYWLAHDGYGSWSARREMVRLHYGEILQRLYLLQDQPTGDGVVDHALDALPDAAAIRDHLRRLTASVDTDPRLAVSVAKDLVESTAKLVLREREVAYSKRDDLPALVARAQEALGLSASGVDSGSEEAHALKTILGSLTRLTQGVTELRNRVGVGHGRESVPGWVRPRHARLAAGAATTWCNLLLETLADPQAPWRGETTGGITSEPPPVVGD